MYYTTTGAIINNLISHHKVYLVLARLFNQQCMQVLLMVIVSMPPTPPVNVWPLSTSPISYYQWILVAYSNVRLTQPIQDIPWVRGRDLNWWILLANNWVGLQRALSALQWTWARIDAGFHLMRTTTYFWWHIPITTSEKTCYKDMKPCNKKHT